MNLLAINVVLAVGWAIVTGQFTLANLVAGFALGYAALWVAQPIYGRSDYFRRVGRIMLLVVHFTYQLLVSGLRVLAAVVAPRLYARPGIVAVPLDAETDAEILLVANLISLTPGTLSLEVAPSRECLYVHVMFFDDVEAVRRAIKTGIERRVLEVMR